MQTVEAAMREAHYAEVQEAIDTDELVKSRVAALIEELTVFGRTL